MKYTFEDIKNFVYKCSTERPEFKSCLNEKPSRHFLEANSNFQETRINAQVLFNIFSSIGQDI